MPDLEQECDPIGGNLPVAGHINPGEMGLLYREGTSMSAAVAAGTAAIVRQYFTEGWWPTGKRDSRNGFSPSGALIKAILMNGAQSLLGMDLNFNGVSTVALYDNLQNFGRINLANSLYLQSEGNKRTAVWDGEVIVEGETKTYEIAYTKSGGCTSKSMSITLVWMDPPGAVGCKACVLNDLDLAVYLKRAPEQIFYPNSLRTNPERIDNAERIKISGLRRRDKIIVEVKASNLVTTSQRYALVANGCPNLTGFYVDFNTTTSTVSITFGGLFLLSGLVFTILFVNERRMKRVVRR